MVPTEQEREVGRAALEYAELKKRVACLELRAKQFGEALVILAERNTESSTLHTEHDPRQDAKDLLEAREKLAEQSRFLMRLGILGD